MEARRNNRKWIPLVAGVVSLTAAGCASGPLVTPRTANVDDSGFETPAADANDGPIRLVSFPSIEVLPLWPSEDEVAETTSTVRAPLAAGTEAVKRGAGQVKQGFVEFGHGARRAVAGTSRWLSRPFVEVRATPGEPSLLQRMFSSEPTYDAPETTREFLAQERVR